MSRKSRRLRGRVQSIECRLKVALTQAQRLKEENARLRKAVLDARSKAASITDKVKGFKLRLLPDDACRHMRQYALTVMIQPERYVNTFLYGGDRNLRDFSFYVHLISEEVAHKIRMTLSEEADKIMGLRA